MKICVAQTRPFKADIIKNIAAHKNLIDLAISNKADAIFFPELSLTGYEPKLAKKLAIEPEDILLDSFQNISDQKNISIGLGMPTKGSRGILISMLIFTPQKVRQTYSKQFLHWDELPYFVNGQSQFYLTIKKNKINPAICYESLLQKHNEIAFNSGANIYLASVAKSKPGAVKAMEHYAKIAKKYSMTVLMANSVGPCDNFESIGKTAAWNNKGVLMGQLDEHQEGILIFDTETGEIIERTLL